MNGKKYIFPIIFFLAVSLSGKLFASAVNFELSVSQTQVSLGESIQLNLSFSGSQNVAISDLPQIDGFNAQYIGPSSSVSIVNGAVSSSVTHIYHLIPLKTGEFKIGPLSVQYKGETLTSNSATVTVVSGSSGSSGRTQPSEANEETLNDRIFLTMEPGKRKFYLNESVPLTVKLYVNRLSVQNVEYPQITPEGFSIDNFGKPRQYRESIEGVVYDVIEFTTSIYGVKSGEVFLGPAALNCAVVTQSRSRRPSSRDRVFDDFFEDDFFGGFFGRRQLSSLSLKSTEVPVVVLSLPEEGKPKDFKGAVGNFNLEVEASPQEVAVGDPITLKMSVTGKGNFDTVTSPSLESEKDFKVYDPQVNQQSGKKTFEQVLMPEAESVKNVPAVTFSFFDPELEKYRTLSQNSIPVKVVKSKHEELKVVDSRPAVTPILVKEELGRDIIYIKESPGRLRRRGVFLYKRKAFLFLNLLPLAGLIFVLVGYKKREKLRTDKRYARGLAAPKKAKKGIVHIRRVLNENKPAEFFDLVFKTTRQYLADKFHLPLGAVTLETMSEIFKQKNLSRDFSAKLSGIFSDCDQVRYAPARFDQAKMEHVFKVMREVIDFLEKRKI